MSRNPSISMQHVSRRGAIGWGEQMRCTYSDESRLEQICVREYTEAGQMVANFFTGLIVILCLIAFIAHIRDYINKR